VIKSLTILVFSYEDLIAPLDNISIKTHNIVISP
jgi:hypothetical protein